MYRLHARYIEIMRRSAGYNAVAHQAMAETSMSGPQHTFPQGGASTGGSMTVGSNQFEGIPQLYYRVTTRVDGPRNTITIVQMSVLIQV